MRTLTPIVPSLSSPLLEVQGCCQCYCCSFLAPRFYIHPAAQMPYSLAYAEETKATTLPWPKTHFRSVKASAVVPNLNDYLAAIPARRYSHSVSFRMLGHVDQQFANRCKKKDAGLVIHRFGLAVRLEETLNGVLLLNLFSKPLKCRLKTKFVQDRQA